MPSHANKPRPGRRRKLPRTDQHRFTFLQFLLTISLILISLCSLTKAVDTESDTIKYRPYQRNRLSRKAEILDDGPPLALYQGAGIDPRQDNGDPFASQNSNSSPSSSASSSSTAPPSTSTSLPSSITAPPTSASAAASTFTSGTPTTLVTASTSVADNPLPSPFDTSLGNNFTSPSCPTFFNNFLNNETFKSCLPLSLLLQNSNSFFLASRSPVLLSQILDFTCAAQHSTCSSLMSSLAKNIIQDSACGQDYQAQNPIVLQAHAGLVAYEPLYRATCLKNPATSNYCFADAITNASNPADSYPYYLALGIALPGSSRPTCTKCLQNAMGIFARAAVDQNQPLSTTYISAAQQIDMGCGPEFVNATVPVGTIKGSGVTRIQAPEWSCTMGFLGVMLAIWFSGS